MNWRTEPCDTCTAPSNRDSAPTPSGSPGPKALPTAGRTTNRCWRSLVLRYQMDAFSAAPASERFRAILDWTWAFVLRPVGEGCRLLVRVRIDPWPWWLQIGLPLL